MPSAIIVGFMDPSVLKARQKRNQEVKVQTKIIKRRHQCKAQAFTPTSGTSLRDVMPASVLHRK